MFGSGITFSGLGSGIDSASLIQRLVQLEGIRKAQLEARKDDAKTKLSAFSKLESLVKTLKTKAEDLSKSGKFLQLAGTASREGVISFDVSSSAATGSHTIDVQQLAANDRWAFDAVLDPDVDLATGAGQQIAFSVGSNSYTVTIDAAASSLDEIASAINEAAGDDVSASVVNSGTESSPSWKLVLAADASGSAGSIHGLSSTIGGLTIDGTEPASGSTTPVSANHLVVGLNAKALVDGLLVERDTNEFAGVIQGVTFNAQSADPGNPVDLSIEPDSDDIVSGVKAFVDAYNEVVRYIEKQNEYSEDDGPGGPLFGDSAMGLVRSTLRSALFDVDLADVQADMEGFSTLTLVGIDVENDGTLTLDRSKLEDKIAENVNALADLFADDDGFDDGDTLPGDPGYGVDTTADSGIAAKLVRAVESLVDRGVGANGTALQSIFSAKQDSLQKLMHDLDTRIDAEDVRLEKFEAGLRTRFANLENLMGGLNSQTAALQALYS